MKVSQRRVEMQQARAEVAEARANVEAVSTVLAALAGATTTRDAVTKALDAVREAFGWVYGSYWSVDCSSQTLCFAAESGDAGPDFRKVTLAASFAEGVGLSGRAWRARDLVFVEDLATISDCVRAPVARRVGVRSGVCFPLFEEGRVVGTMDFFTTETLHPSAGRLTSLKAVGLLISQALERIAERERQQRAAQDMAAVNAVLERVAATSSANEAASRALEVIRQEFGWAYGSYWAVDDTLQALTFVLESGSAGQEFRDVTLTASFKEGVGLSGRTWRERQLVFVPDLGEVTDCVRAPAAQRAGVKSGVCLPLIVRGRVVGTMDFFATERLELTPGRRDALANTAFLVSQAMERAGASDQLATAGTELMSSIEEVERNVAQASSVSADAATLTADANALVARLEESSRKIGEVVKVINAIASQTNLLALNATIEAARAGEAGKGFAVVAGEVKTLAQETAQATDEVSTRVAAIQADASGVISSLSDIQHIVDRINETQTQIGGVLAQQTAVTRAILGS